MEAIKCKAVQVKEKLIVEKSFCVEKQARKSEGLLKIIQILVKKIESFVKD